MPDKQNQGRFQEQCLCPKKQGLRRCQTLQGYKTLQFFSDRTRIVACSGCSGIFDFGLFGSHRLAQCAFLSAKRKRRTSASQLSDKHTAVVNKATRSLTSTLQQATK